MNFHFDDFVVDPNKRRLWKKGQEIQVRERTLRLILILLQHRERAIGKAELLAHLWPDAHVTESSLFECINDARQILGDNAKRSRYIETVRKVGYKWAFSDVSVSKRPVRKGRQKILAFSLAAALLSLVSLFFFAPAKTTPVQSIYIASIASENDGGLRLGLLELLRTRLEENPTYTVHCERGIIPPTNLDQVKKWAEKNVGPVDRILVIQVNIQADQPNLHYVFINGNRIKKKNTGPNTLSKTWVTLDHWLTESAGLALPPSAIPGKSEFLEPYFQGVNAYQKKQFLKAKAHWSPLALNEPPPFMLENLASTFLHLNQTDKALVLAEKLARQPHPKWHTSGLFFMAWCSLLRGDANYLESLTSFIQEKNNQKDFHGLQTLIEDHTSFLLRTKNYSEALAIFEQNFDHLVRPEPTANKPYKKLLDTLAEQLKAQEKWELYERSIRLCLRFPSIQNDAEASVYTIGKMVRSLRQGGNWPRAIQVLEECAPLVERHHPEDMDAYYYMATHIYYQHGDYEKALSLSDSTIAAIGVQDKLPEKVKAMFSKSWILFDLGFWNRAAQQAQAAEELAIKVEYHRVVADLKILLTLIENQITGNWPPLEELVSHVENANPLSVLALLIAIRDVGILHAITPLFEAHPHFPKRKKWVPPFLEGLRAREQSHSEKAIQLFNQALEKTGNQVNEPWGPTHCSYLIAQTYAEMGSWSAGLPSIEEAFAAYPQDFRHWSLLARYYQNLGQHQKAASILAIAKKRLGLAWRREWDLVNHGEREHPR